MPGHQAGAAVQRRRAASVRRQVLQPPHMRRGGKPGTPEPGPEQGAAAWLRNLCGWS